MRYDFMNMIDWLNKIISPGGLITTPLEILGFITGAVFVYLNTRQNVLGWFFGIINAALYAVVFLKVKLYADVSLQVYYFATSIYGWYMWKFGGKNHDELSVSSLPARLYLILAAIFLIVTLSWGFLLGRFTDASLTYADAALTVASLIGQWMMTRKYLENWLLWIVADVAYTAMYFYKDLYLTAILYAVFTMLAVLGYFQWRKDLARAF